MANFNAQIHDAHGAARQSWDAQIQTCVEGFSVTVRVRNESAGGGPSAHTGQSAALLACSVPLVLSLAVFAAGCRDNRISLAQMNRMEAEALSARHEPSPKRVAPPSLTEQRELRVAPGDVLTLSMTGLTGPYDQTTLKARVRRDGQVHLPLVGPVRVGGKTLADVEEAIVSAYVPDYVKQLTVFAELTSPAKTTVLVKGAVGKPGLTLLERDKRNILHALQQAVGYNVAASGRVRVRPIDPQQEEQVYDLTDINDLRRAMAAPPLQPGDLVIVEPAQPSVIYVTGLVNSPGPISVPANTTLSLMRALSASGGLVDFLEPQEATLWRRLPDGRQVRAKLALADIVSGKAEDVQLRPGDILDVPHTVHTRFRQWFSENIVIGPFGVTATYDPLADRRAKLLDDNDDNGIFGQTLLGSLQLAVPSLINNATN
ncbi:MAG: hypothetical protein D6744_00045 [Planctomycetota bacterium]|nr:MAG: hypothetical protein D6744_00045 [Planctomycetota bacterium]